MLFHPQSCWWVVDFGNAAAERGGAETPGLVWCQSWAWLCPLQKDPDPPQGDAGGLRAGAGYFGGRV